MEALPIGTQRIKSRTVRKQYVRRQRFVKVSHHGQEHRRWRPLARYWWEQNIGPVPEGYQVYHRDGDSLHDDPTNYVLCRADRFKLIFANSPEASQTQHRRRSKAVAKANRRRGRVNRSQIKATAWYLVLPESKGIVWQPCRTRLAARRLDAPIALLTLCRRNWTRLEKIGARQYALGDPAFAVRGDELLRESQADGRFEGFVRLIPDTRRAPKKRAPAQVDNLFDALRTD